MHFVDRKPQRLRANQQLTVVNTGDARLIERWRPLDERPEILSEELVWHPRADLPPFRLALQELFDDAAR